MTASDELFALIKSLTASEKRYFKIWATKHVIGKSNNYEKLFDALDVLPDDKPYDEVAFKKTLRGKSYGKYLSDEKAHLKEIIMQSMRIYYAESSVDNQIHDLLKDEDFYRQKRLNTLRKKALTKAKELAIKYEKLTFLSTLFNKELLMDIEVNQHLLKDISDKLPDGKKELLRKIDLYEDINRSTQWLFIQFRLNASNPDAALLEAIEAEINKPHIVDYATGDSFVSDSQYHKCYIYYSRLTKNIALELLHSDMRFHLYQRYPHMQVEYSMDYRIFIFNYLSTLMAAEDWKRYEEILDAAKKFPAVSENEIGENFQNIAFYEQILYMNTGQIDKACEMSKTILAGIKKHKAKINKTRELTMYMNLAVAHFIKEKWNDCLTYLDKIIEDKTDVRRDIKTQAALLTFICYVELKKFDTLSNALRNIARSKEADKFSSAMYAPFFTLMKALVKTPDVKEYLKKHADEHVSLGVLSDEIKLWLESKSSNQKLEKLFLGEMHQAA